MLLPKHEKPGVGKDGLSLTEKLYFKVLVIKGFVRFPTKCKNHCAEGAVRETLTIHLDGCAPSRSSAGPQRRLAADLAQDCWMGVRNMTLGHLYGRLTVDQSTCRRVKRIQFIDVGASL